MFRHFDFVILLEIRNSDLDIEIIHTERVKYGKEAFSRFHLQHLNNNLQPFFQDFSFHSKIYPDPVFSV